MSLHGRSDAVFNFEWPIFRFLILLGPFSISAGDPLLNGLVLIR